MFLSLVVSQSLNSRHKAVNPIRMLNVPLGLPKITSFGTSVGITGGFESKRAAATARLVFR